MQVMGSTRPLEEIDAHALAVAVFKGETADRGDLKPLDAIAGGMISEAIRAEEFIGKEGETAYFHVTNSKVKARRVLLVGCGERDSYKARQITQMAGAAARFLRGKNAQTIAIAPRTTDDPARVAQTVMAGALMGPNQRPRAAGT